MKSKLNCIRWLLLFLLHSISWDIHPLSSVFHRMTFIPNWIVGASLALLSTALGSLGKVLVRCVHLIRTSESFPDFLKTKWSKFPWVASLLLQLSSVDSMTFRTPLPLLSLLAQSLVVVINPALSILSYSFAAQSLLTPFAGLSVVWSLLFTSLLLPEAPNKEQFKSTFFITAYPFVHHLCDRSFIDKGCILIGLSASHSALALTVADLIQSSLSIKSLLFNIAYFISILFLVFSIYWPYMDRLNKVRGYFSAYPFLIDLPSVCSPEL